MEQPRPHSKSAGDQVQSHLPSALSVPDQPRPHSVGGDDDGIRGQLTTPTDQLRQRKSGELASEPVSSRSSTCSPRLSGNSESSSKPAEATSGEEGPLVRKMTKKEKRFALSKDRGQYSELNPISPHEAKKEFGESLHLKPVESPVGYVAVGGAVGGAAADGTSLSSAVPQPNASGTRRWVGRGCGFREGYLHVDGVDASLLY